MQRVQLSLLGGSIGDRTWLSHRRPAMPLKPDDATDTAPEDYCVMLKSLFIDNFAVFTFSSSASDTEIHAMVAKLKTRGVVSRLDQATTELGKYIGYEMDGKLKHWKPDNGKF